MFMSFLFVSRAHYTDIIIANKSKKLQHINAKDMFVVFRDSVSMTQFVHHRRVTSWFLHCKMSYSVQIEYWSQFFNNFI